METSNITLRRLKTFLKSLENKFALKNHTHLSDSELSTTSTNPVQNKVITNEFNHQSTEMLDIKMLGWTVPRECPIQNEVNVNQFIQKVGRVDLGDLKWVLDSTSFYTIDLHSIIKGVDNPSLIANIYLKGYTTVARNNLANKTICLTNTNTIRLIDNSYNNTIAFKQAMQGQYLYYELANYITKTIDGNEIGETVSNVRKETTVNLLNPTFETTTSNGVTFTNNGDNSFTIKGTSTGSSYTNSILIPVEIGKKYNLVGKYIAAYLKDNIAQIVANHGDVTSTIFTATEDKVNICLYVVNNDGKIDNVVTKPMLTTNLDATYDDFVPYTGDTGSLNGDVADVRKYVDNKVSKSSVVNNLVTTESGYALDARQGYALDKKITNLKKSVSDGKSTIASAITAKGVSTASDATYETMAKNISALSVGDDTTTTHPIDIIRGQTAYVKGEKITGTLPRLSYNRNVYFHGSCLNLVCQDNKTLRYGQGSIALYGTYISYESINFILSTRTGGNVFPTCIIESNNSIVFDCTNQSSIISSFVSTSTTPELTTIKNISIYVTAKSDINVGSEFFRVSFGLSDNDNGSVSDEGMSNLVAGTQVFMNSTSEKVYNAIIDVSSLRGSKFWQITTTHGGKLIIHSITYNPYPMN